jgi:hypothetical protein
LTKREKQVDKRRSRGRQREEKLSKEGTGRQRDEKVKKKEEHTFKGRSRYAKGKTSRQRE